jgi:hypothetical protein
MANTWLETKNSLYVLDGYWTDGYVVGIAGWTDVSTNSNTWLETKNSLYVDNNYFVDGYVVGVSGWVDV